MPIVINEIEIAVEVTPDGLQGNTGALMSGTVKEEIIRECVEKVMEILREKNER
jgi:hypothetical protein